MMDKAQFLSAVRADWARWQAALDEVGRARMTQPGAAGEWSVKDMVAHVTWFEREMVNVIRRRVFEGSELWNVSQDARNKAIFEENRGRALDDVLGESERIHQDLVDALEELPEEHYANPARFRGMPADWVPWQVFAGNTYEHYRDHTTDVRAWLDGPHGPSTNSENE
jgi:uncharacterized protein (TIGR03083 family)